MIDRSLMAVFALLVVRRYELPKRDRKRAAHAAILAWYTWTMDEGPPSEGRAGEKAKRMVPIYEKGVLKALQRLESGRQQIHPELMKAVSIAYRETGEPVLGRPEEIAEAVARFLPKR